MLGEDETGRLKRGDGMTFADIEKKARRLLGDTTYPYHWPIEELRDHAQEGLRSINAIRPETRYVNGLVTDGTVLPSTDDAVIEMNDRYEEALVYFVVYRCYLNDNTDTENAQLSESYLSKFNMKVQL